MCPSDCFRMASEFIGRLSVMILVIIIFLMNNPAIVNAYKISWCEACDCEDSKTMKCDGYVDLENMQDVTMYRWIFIPDCGMLPAVGSIYPTAPYATFICILPTQLTQPTQLVQSVSRVQSIITSTRRPNIRYTVSNQY